MASKRSIPVSLILHLLHWRHDVGSTVQEKHILLSKSMWAKFCYCMNDLEILNSRFGMQAYGNQASDIAFCFTCWNAICFSWPEQVNLNTAIASNNDKIQADTLIGYGQYGILRFWKNFYYNSGMKKEESTIAEYQENVCWVTIACCCLHDCDGIRDTSIEMWLEVKRYAYTRILYAT